jgi:hypothetical protein
MTASIENMKKCYRVWLDAFSHHPLENTAYIFVIAELSIAYDESIP